METTPTTPEGKVETPAEKKTRFEKWRAEQRAVRIAVQERLSGAIIGAFGLIAGIAWNDAVRAAIDYFYPPAQGSDIIPKFMYAIIVTLLVSIFIYIVTKFLVPKKPQV